MFPVNIAKFLRVAFYRTSPVAASAEALFYIIFLRRRCLIYCRYTLHNCFIRKPKITLIGFHSLPFVVPLVTICSHSLFFVVTCCHSFSLIVLLVVTRCHLLYHSLSFAFTRCNSLSLGLLLVVTRCTTRLSFYKRSLLHNH